ncbi:MAG TPA: type II secretion system F family protein, partial [Alicyclobacillus sp.]|nr:type II secretion system F family protein [Alicyclobacillus sp.]
MALFRYQAVNRAGKAVRGQIEAADAAAATADLRRQGLFPMRIDPAAEGRARSLGLGGRGPEQAVRSGTPRSRAVPNP